MPPRRTRHRWRLPVLAILASVLVIPFLELPIASTPVSTPSDARADAPEIPTVSVTAGTSSVRPHSAVVTDPVAPGRGSCSDPGGCGPAAAPTTAARPSDADPPSSWENLTNVTEPTGRQGAAFAYDPAGGYDLLFGGESTTVLGDTWTFESDTWTAEACPCPSPRAYSAMAYYPTLREMVLFGGLASTYSLLYGNRTQPVADTWTWNASTSTWTNISSSISGAPSARYGASMAWDAELSALLLFGGNTGTGAVGDTWEFNGTAWSELTESAAPSARWGAAFANSSQGYDLLFGGATPTATLGDAWIFYDRNWTELPGCPGCMPSPRAFAAVAEIPATGNPVVFGGIDGSTVLDDSWVASVNLSVPGAPTATWTPDPSAPPPPATWAASFASDYHRGVIVLFGGGRTSVGATFSNSTWGYFRLYGVLRVSVPELRVGSRFELTSLEFGGNGPYQFVYSGLPSPCASASTDRLECTPGQWGIYTVTVTITDSRGRMAEANVSVQVDPPDARLTVLSQYAGYFFTDLNLTNTFGVSATVFGESPISVRATFGALPLTFERQASGVWNASANMAGATPGAPFDVTAVFANWTLRATTTFDVVASPGWLTSVAEFPTVIETVSSSGSGPWNESYELSYTEEWGLGSLGVFSIPTSFLSGAFSLLPIPQATMDVRSNGAVTLSGGLAYPPPGLSFGPFTLTEDLPGGIKAKVAISGTFSPDRVANGSYAINWTSAWLNVTLGGKFNTSVPIVGIDVPGIGEVGIDLDIEIAPSVALSLLLIPTAPGESALIDGLALSLARLSAELTIEVTAAITAGITDILTVSGGGTLDLSLLFGSTSPYFDGVWLNGSLFLAAQFLWWTFKWTFLGPGTIWSWTADPPPSAADAVTDAPDATTDTPAVWSPLPRYYNTSDYDVLAWTPGAKSGEAIANVFPEADPSAAGDGGGAIALYAADDVQAPVGAIRLEALSLDGSSGSVGRLPALVVPGDAAFAPVVGSLPTGGYVAVFDTVPRSMVGLSSPAGISGLREEAATLAPGSSSWSTPIPLTSGGFPQSSLVGRCGGQAESATLVAPTLLPGSSTPEWLLLENPVTGQLLANRTVMGGSRLTGFDCPAETVLLQASSGNLTEVDLASGVARPISAPAPAGASLRSATFVNGTATDLLLLDYATSSGAWAELYDPDLATVVGTLELPANASGLWAARVPGGFYVFAGETDAVAPYFLNGSTTRALPSIPAPGLRSFVVAPETGAFAVVVTSANSSGAEPIDALSVAFVPAPSSPTPGPSPSGPNRVEITEIGILGGLVAATAVVAIAQRRRGRRAVQAPPSPSPEAPSGEPPGSTRPP